MKRFIKFYRPTLVSGIVNNTIVYQVGDLRASLFGIRVPILWAISVVYR